MKFQKGVDLQETKDKELASEIKLLLIINKIKDLITRLVTINYITQIIIFHSLIKKKVNLICFNIIAYLYFLFI